MHFTTIFLFIVLAMFLMSDFYFWPLDMWWAVSLFFLALCLVAITWQVGPLEPAGEALATILILSTMFAPLLLLVWVVDDVERPPKRSNKNTEVGLNTRANVIMN